MTQPHTPPLLPFITFALLLARASATHISCYTGDGAEDTGPQPCPGSNMCCYLNRTDGYADDVCIQGACYSNYWTGQYFVIGCTSQNWNEEGSGCSPLWDVCGRQSGYTHVTRCNDGSFCCGDSNAACCNSYSGVYLNEDGTEILQSSESGPLPDTTTSSTDVPYSSPIPTSLQTRVLTSTGTSTTNLPSQTATATNAPSADQSEEGLSTEAKIGIGVGVPAVVLAALTLWRQCRPNRP